MKECILFIRNSLSDLGGIETYVYKAIKQIQNQGDGAGWITNDFSKINNAFKDLIDSSAVYKIDRMHAKKQIEKILLNGMFEKTIIVTFCPHDFCCAENIKRKLSNFKIFTFMFVPHFQGGALYLEEGVHFFQGALKRQLGKVYRKMELNGNLRYFAPRHLEEFRNRYGCETSDYKTVDIPEAIDTIDFDVNRVKKVYNQRPFNILCVSRMEFPHKGYMLGMIDDFKQLCEKYDFLKLTLVGDGRDKGKLEEKIGGLDENTKRKIQVVGAVAPDMLCSYYDQANVLVSVAGCFTLGARRGLCLQDIIRKVAKYMGICQIANRIHCQILKERA